MGSEVERWLSQNAIALFVLNLTRSWCSTRAKQGRTYCMHMMLPQVVIRHMCTSCIFKIWEEMFDRNCSRSLAHNCTKCPPDNSHFKCIHVIISLNTDNVCVAGKWDKRTGHNAPLRPRWDFLIVFFVWSRSCTEIVFGEFWLLVGWLPVTNCWLVGLCYLLHIPTNQL